MNHRLVLALAALPLLVAGCGSGSSSSAGATHVMPDGTVMSGSSMSHSDHADQMSGDSGSGAGTPTETASMICGPEIREAVAHTLGVEHAPRGLHSWSDPRFRCSYLVGAGELRLSVQDLDAAGPGRAYFDHLRTQVPQAHDLRGLANFGFPAFESAHGDVVFLKDHKTLWVDASRLDPTRLTGGMSREDVAYGVAAAVIACWTE